MQPFEFEKDYYEFIKIEMLRFKQPMTKILTEFLMKKYGTRYWKTLDITNNGKLDAYIIAGVEDNGHLHVFSVAVKEDFEGQGWGKYMIEQIISDARKNEISKIYLEVREDNHRAIKLYKSLGFVQTAFAKNYYDTNEHALEMEYNIST